jgi:solute carrier family 25 (mitochondrial aspartate/glutamate transporter), member 12/13
MATVTEAVKESLLGTTQPAELSQESRVTFLAHAQQGNDGEYHMKKEDFINAIAPPEEDYVSLPLTKRLVHSC